MKNKEILELINDINDFIFKISAEELSFTTMLKVDEYFQKLRNKIIMEGWNSDRIKKRNGLS